MGKALETLHKTREELRVEKRVWLKQNDHDIADKINEEILDIEVAISELVRKGKNSEREQANELLPLVSGSALLNELIPLLISYFYPPSPMPKSEEMFEKRIQIIKILNDFKAD